MKKLECDRPMDILKASRETVGQGLGCIDSQRIFGNRNEVLIRHGDHIYRLRKTRYGKLILNK